MNIQIRKLHLSVVVLAVLVLGAAAAYMFVPPVRDGLTLLQCKAYMNGNAQSECVFQLIKERLLSDGIGPALDMFMLANKLFPNRLDIDCHAGIHRVGDMAYYNLFYNDPSVTGFVFPEEAKICNRGFFHGIFEHLFQDRPDPVFIAETCKSMGNNPNPDIAAVAGTCFHAAGHGLFRAQTEKVPESQWGIPEKFVEEPAALCESFKGVKEIDRYNCVTGVESIFIQSSLLREYGLSNPDSWNTLGVCNQLAGRFHNTCYFVRALMVAEMADGYDKIIDDCLFTDDALFGACVRGTIVGLFVNGVNDRSFQNALGLCEDSRVVGKGARGQCYENFTDQIRIEYWGEYTPDCSLFPEEFRPRCIAISAKS